MALIKNEIPILEYDTDENAVIDTKAEGLTPFPEKAVFAFLKDEVERYALSSGGELLDISRLPQRIFRYMPANMGESGSVCVRPRWEERLPCRCWIT